MSNKILIIEDEESLSKILSRKLTARNIEVQVEENGEDAAKKAIEQDFDLIVLDLLLPKKTGLWALEKILENKPTSKVLVVSNMSKGADVKNAQKLGILEYITKADTSINDIVNKIIDKLKN